ncbi:MAG: hypothetical protein C4523_02515 [Myxococcales bacterium]|nr:MAG: hypothetical protein C4523_02515 [Myxococcales bacterium]
MAALLNPQRWLTKPSYPVEANEAHWFAQQCSLIMPMWQDHGLINVGRRRDIVPAFSGNSRMSVDAFDQHYNIATLGDYIDCGAVTPLQVNSFTLLCVVRPGTIAAITTVAQSNFTAGAASDSGMQFRLSALGKVDLIKDNVAAIYGGTRALTTTKAHAVGLSYNSSTGLCSVAIDGTPDGTATSAQTFTHNKFVLGRKRGNDLTETQLHRDYLFAHAGYIATMAELCNLTAEPYAILRPRRSMLYFPVSVAGGGETVQIGKGTISYAEKIPQSNVFYLIGRTAIQYTGKATATRLITSVARGAVNYNEKTLKANSYSAVGKGSAAYSGKATNARSFIEIAKDTIIYAGKAVTTLGQSIVNIATGAINYTGKAIATGATAIFSVWLGRSVARITASLRSGVGRSGMSTVSNEEDVNP